MLGKLLIGLLAAAGVFAGFVAWKAARVESAAEAAYPPEGQILRVDGVAVHALTLGSGPDLVLIHGASGNTRDWTFSIAGKLAETYRVIVMDRPGLGYSDAVSSTGDSIFVQAQVMQAAARQLGADAPLVVGQSYGGAVALAWARDYPVAGLVLLGAPSQRWEGGLSTFYKITSSRVGQALVVPLLTAFVSDSYIADTIESIFEPQAAPEGYGAHIGAGLSLRRSSLRQNANQRASLKEEITDLVPSYPSITAPVELVHGTADIIVPVSIHSVHTAQSLPDAVLTELDGIGHMPQHVAEADVIDAIDRVAARAGLR